jgi:Leucine-rich repeat (LRR) protein
VWQVNGFFREYIISREMQDNLVFELEGHCTLNTQHVGQHLTISSNWDRDKLVFESMELSRLRSLTIFGKWMPFFISADANMRLLRVLDLENASGVIDGDLEQIGKLLPRLKFLSLRGCQDITHLPSSFGDLRQLQTLDIKGTSIVMLPPAITKLEKLQCIRAGTIRCIATSSNDDSGTVAGVATLERADCHSASTSHPRPPPAAIADDEAQTSKPWRRRPHSGFLFRSSKFGTQGHAMSTSDGVQFFVANDAVGVDKMKALHTLGNVNVGVEGGNVILREIGKLTQLRQLWLSGISQKNWPNLCSVVDGHCHLMTLSVRLNHDQKVCCLGDISKPPMKLRSLKMYGGNVHVTPVWMKQLDRLVKLDLGDNDLTISTQEDIDILKDLRCTHMIRHICIKPIRDGELHFRWLGRYFSRLNFENCKFLKIDCGGYKLALTFWPGMAHFVEVLVVHCDTTESSLVLSRLENLPSLKEVWLKGSYSDALKQHLQQKLHEHENKPDLKLD